jgi:hypothetical protein
MNDAEKHGRNIAPRPPFTPRHSGEHMTDRNGDPEAPAKRGRAEIRWMFAIVIAILVLGGLYVAIFGSPNAENRLRDSPNYAPPMAPATGTR